MSSTSKQTQQAVEKQLPEDGRQRAVIEAVQPEIDCGRFPIKRVIGEAVRVEADVYAEGHDLVAGEVLYRRADESAWCSLALQPIVNDRWQAEFTVTELVQYVYALRAWVDYFTTWRNGFARKVEAAQDISVDLLIGAELVEAAARRADAADAARLSDFAARLRADQDNKARIVVALDPGLAALMDRYPDLRFATTYDKGLAVEVDRERARFSTWYELFPRSASPDPSRTGTLKDVEARLPYIAAMGFDVLYLPPLSPIGESHRKGRNNSIVAEPGDPGSPWAIGSRLGGHTVIQPELGTLDGLRSLREAAARHGIELALDLAFQTSPDHPYVGEHPEWYRSRPDGTIQYAENPPKRYEDIYPFDFESEAWRALWHELLSVALFWIEQGIRIFRVDNPHTKPFAFWEWFIHEIKRDYPETIFLAEAFTRPKVMYRLAKAGFTQSYTYFAWRDQRWNLIEYLTELTQTPAREFFRPNFWPNTPDILTEQLQYGGRATFVARLILAATLGASYGVYGPTFELMEHIAVAPGKEEYLDSEKYQSRFWDLDRPDSLRELIGRVNRIRRGHHALQSNASLRFHQIDNEQLIAYSKIAEDDIVLIVVNLDRYYTQSGWLTLPLEEFGIDPQEPYQAHDLLSDAYYRWSGPTNYVELNPSVSPAHIFEIRHHLRGERDFEYFL